MKYKKIILICGLVALVCELTGCEAFVRKFTRKPKKGDIKTEEMVLEPQVYKSSATTEELYREYLLYWKSWQSELIQALEREGSHKKQLSCIKEAIKNLTSLRGLMDEQEQNKLDVYLARLKSLEGAINKDLYGNNLAFHRHEAECIKRDVLLYFSYSKVKKKLNSGPAK